MKKRLSLVEQISLVMCLLVSNFAVAQSKAPDAQYRQVTKAIDSLTNMRFIRGDAPTTILAKNKRAAHMFSLLAKDYRLLTTDMMLFFDVSIKGNDAAAFYTAGRLLILNSGDPITKFLEGDDTSYLASVTFSTAIKKLRKEEAGLIKQAHSNLDWNWNLAINALFTADQNFRKIPPGYFKDTLSRIEAMIKIDSIHFMQLCTLIADNGFPAMSRVGLNAAMLQGPIKHFTGLVYIANEDRATLFITKWKGLMAYLGKAAMAGEMEPKFYCYICNEVIEGLKQYNRTEEVKYFQQFQCN